MTEEKKSFVERNFDWLIIVVGLFFIFIIVLGITFAQTFSARSHSCSEMLKCLPVCAINSDGQDYCVMTFNTYCVHLEQDWIASKCDMSKVEYRDSVLESLGSD